MKLIILGSNGMLGNYLTSYLSKQYEVISLTRKDLDISRASEQEILQFMREHVREEDVILNASGIIKQREYNVVDMIRVNSLFPHILATYKKESGCNVIHITTDCVFSGKIGGYRETDLHDCLDDYGKSKSLGENDTITNIRTSIIGEERVNKKSLMEWVISKSGKTIDGYENHIWNGITCLEAAKLIEEIIQRANYWKGVRHVFSPTKVSKYELIKMINEIYQLGITVNKKTTDTPCHRDLATLYEPMVKKGLREQIIEIKEFKDLA